MHLAYGAHFAPFAGYEMPVQYVEGILSEHRHVRSSVGLFDVSHMGQICVRAVSGNMLDAARALEQLIPMDVINLPGGRQRYAVLTCDAGGVREDLMVANTGSDFLLTVNAAAKQEIFDDLRARLAPVCITELLTDRVLLALQGPDAADVLANICPASQGMSFLAVAELNVHVDSASASRCVLSRSGYTGEDGYEISISAGAGVQLADRLLADQRVRWVGLGARDTLRLEAGLCLYGQDLRPNVSPIEAGLQWTIPRVRRSGGDRAGGFPGAEHILREIQEGAARHRVGLRPGTRPLRTGTALYPGKDFSRPIGEITSGTFSPSLNAPIAMGYVEDGWQRGGTDLYAELKGQRYAVQVSSLPFVPHRYVR